MNMKSTQQLEDGHILLAIRRGGISKERCINSLFKQHHKLVLYGQRRYKLTLIQSKEVYLDSLLALSSAIEQDRFKGGSKISTYLFRIFENRCKNKVRDSMRYEAKYEWVYEIPQLSDRARDMLKKMIIDEQMEWLEKLMEKIGKKCRKIIMMSEFLGYSLEEIGEKLQISSRGAVATTKYRCIQKLRSLVTGFKSKTITGQK